MAGSGTSGGDGARRDSSGVVYYNQQQNFDNQIDDASRRKNKKRLQHHNDVKVSVGKIDQSLNSAETIQASSSFLYSILGMFYCKFMRRTIALFLLIVMIDNVHSNMSYFVFSFYGYFENIIRFATTACRFQASLIFLPKLSNND